MKSTHNRRTFLSVGLVAILSLSLFTGCTTKTEAPRTKLGTVPDSILNSAWVRCKVILIPRTSRTASP